MKKRARAIGLRPQGQNASQLKWLMTGPAPQCWESSQGSLPITLGRHSKLPNSFSLILPLTPHHTTHTTPHTHTHTHTHTQTHTLQSGHTNIFSSPSSPPFQAFPPAILPACHSAFSLHLDNFHSLYRSHLGPGTGTLQPKGQIWPTTCFCRASLVAQVVKNLPATQETPVWFLGQEELMEKE